MNLTDRIERCRGVLLAMQAMAEATTPGPWHACTCGKCGQFCGGDVMVGRCDYERPASDAPMPTLQEACRNAVFVATARTQWPQTIDGMLAVLDAIKLAASSAINDVGVGCLIENAMRGIERALGLAEEGK